MQMGVKEFRERFSEVALGDRSVSVTHHGKLVGIFTPLRPKDPERVRAAAASMEALQAKAIAGGYDPEATMASLGLDPWGEPLDGDARR